jgi:hypothetical protein
MNATKISTMEQEPPEDTDDAQMVRLEEADMVDTENDNQQNEICEDVRIESPLKINLEKNSTITTKTPDGATQKVTTIGPAQINLENARMANDTTITQEVAALKPMQEAEDEHANLEIKDSNIIFK